MYCKKLRRLGCRLSGNPTLINWPNVRGKIMSKKTLSIRLLTTLIVSFSSATFAAKPATDISDIQLGSSFASVKPLLAKINPNYQIKEDKESIMAFVNKDNNPDLFLIGKNKKDLVFFIARSQTLDQGKRIKKETLIQAIEEKYGKPTEVSSDMIMWEFDQNGSLNSEEKCHFGANKKRFDMKAYTIIPNVSGFKLEENCSRRYYLNIQEDSEAPGMISAFSVQLIDINFMLEELRQAELEKQKVIEQEAKTNKPKL